MECAPPPCFGTPENNALNNGVCGWREKEMSACPNTYVPEQICWDFIKCSTEGNNCLTYLDRPAYEKCVECFRYFGAVKDCDKIYERVAEGTKNPCRAAIEDVIKQIGSLDRSCETDDDCGSTEYEFDFGWGNESFRKPGYSINKANIPEVNRRIEDILSTECSDRIEGKHDSSALTYKPGCKNGLCGWKHLEVKEGTKGYYMEGLVLVYFQENVTEKEAASLVDSFNLTWFSDFSDILFEYEVKSPDGNSEFYKQQLEASSIVNNAFVIGQAVNKERIIINFNEGVSNQTAFDLVNSLGLQIDTIYDRTGRRFIVDVPLGEELKWKDIFEKEKIVAYSMLSIVLL